jgi:anti-sigma B factor antagonist
MKLTQQQYGAVTLLRPDGPMVEADVPDLAKSLKSLLDSTLGRVVVDMSAVAFVDSIGLEALLDISEDLMRGGRSLKLCALNKTIRQVLDLTAIDGHFDLYEDVNSAVRSFL